MKALLSERGTTHISAIRLCRNHRQSKLFLDLSQTLGKNPRVGLIKKRIGGSHHLSENKTKQTQASVANYFAGIKDDTRRRDCEALAKLMTKVTKEKPRMWGTSIVGFGIHHY